MVSVTGCNDNDTDDLPPPPAADPAAAGSQATVDPAHQPILDAYRGSVQAMLAAQAAGDPEHPDLTRFFAEGTPALFNVVSGVERHTARGTYYAGDLIVTAAEVTDLDLTTTPPEAIIESCLDSTNYRLVRREDNTPVPEAEPGRRYLVISKALQNTDDRWYIVETQAEWETEC
ncbi:MAG: hypothetical protein GEV12_05965 [Micromonosporaceae bacterium]|nr:hypothetical protein [Micromonosporaceae bacterium]